MNLLDFYHRKKVFVTGATGFKGAWLCQILLEAGAEVISYSLESPTKPALFDQLNLKQKITHVHADVRDLNKLVDTLKKASPEMVIHLAAQPLVLESYKNPVETYEINVMGTVNLLQSILQTTSVRSVVNVTTDKVYENKEWLWGYRENENLCGHDPYSNSKSCSELVTHSFRNSFFTNHNSPAVSTARSGNVIGGGDYSENRIIPDCIRAAQEGADIIVRNPNSVRPYQFVLECLCGYLMLLAKQHDKRDLIGAYNFGPDDRSCVSTGQLAEMFCKLWGGDLAWKNVAVDNPHEANLLRLDHAKAKMMLAWQPKWDIEVAIEKTIEYAKCKNDTDRQKLVRQQITDYFKEISI